MENLQIAYELIENIKNGVELETGEKREYDIIDFLITYRIDFVEFYNSVKNLLGIEAKKTLKIFYNKYVDNSHNCFGPETKISNEIVYENIMSTSFTENAKTDENNNVIPNSGRKITEEEKIKLIDFFKSLNIQVTTRMLNCGIKRIGKGYYFEGYDFDDSQMSM